jgi:hypothetical protein
MGAPLSAALAFVRRESFNFRYCQRALIGELQTNNGGIAESFWRRRLGITRYQKGKVDMIEGSTCGSFRWQLLKFATLFAATVLSGSFEPALLLQKTLAPHPETRQCGASSLPITTTSWASLFSACGSVARAIGLNQATDDAHSRFSSAGPTGAKIMFPGIHGDHPVR